MITRRTVLFVAVISMALCSKAVYGQGSSGVILVVEVENLLRYREDTSDLSKFATDPNPTIPTPPRNFYFVVYIGDIVAVNGQPAKGTFTRNRLTLGLTTTPTPARQSLTLCGLDQPRIPLKS